MIWLIRFVLMCFELVLSFIRLVVLKWILVVFVNFVLCLFCIDLGSLLGNNLLVSVKWLFVVFERVIKLLSYG